MPRLNIEDIWWEDPRRDLLVQRIGFATDAVALKMWRLAQTYYRLGMLVPVELYHAVPHAEDFMAVGLAYYASGQVDAHGKQTQAKGDNPKQTCAGVYIKGRDEYFGWLKARSEAGSAKKPKEKKPKKTRNAPGQQNEAKPNNPQQPETSSSISSSPSGSGDPPNPPEGAAGGPAEFRLTPPDEPGPPAEVSHVTLVRRAYEAAYAKRYGEAQEWNAKQAGLVSQILERLPKADVPALAAWYVEHPKAFYAQAKHPLGLLLKDCEVLHVEWKTNRPTTGLEAKQGEKFAAGMAQVQRLQAKALAAQIAEESGQ